MFGIVSLYYYRHQVLPVKYAEKIDVYAQKIHPKLISFARQKQILTETASVEEMIQKDTEQSVVVTESVESEQIKEEPKDIDVVTEQKVTSVEKVKAVDEVKVGEEIKQDQRIAADDVPVADNDKPQAVTEMVTVDDSSKEKEIVASVSDVTPEIIEGKVESQGALTTDKEAASVNDLLRSARQAFNSGKLDVAITQYNSLISLDHDEADFYGELGNVHYAMGSWEKAGAAYYEAATRLIEKRQFSQIRYLQRVIKGLDSERAEKLENQLANLN